MCWFRVTGRGRGRWPTCGTRCTVALWARGDTDLLAAPDGTRVGIVGARASTSYGEHVAGELAGYRSGALNTASHAARLGRPVGAVPGPVTSAASAGCHRVLREGIAGVVTNAEGVTRMLADQPAAARAGRVNGLAVEFDCGVSGRARRPETPGLSH
ncbi:DNA-processing protein DprA [Brevibacterium picturae]|uniref:Smf/DprA SLOG domain-containing protein n=1 Tax=Brevibacterium picturae TaxID=260553 RepID=A0ABN2CTH2_9MICO